MINHARTLLGNLAPTTVDRQFYDEQYVPSEFQPLTLSTSLSKLRSFLFGNKPDRSFINARLRELLSVVKVSLYGEYLLAFDTRLLELNEDGQAIWITDEPVLISSTLSSTSLIQMRSSKEVTEADYNGWMDFAYTLTLVGETEIQIKRKRPTTLQINREIIFRNGVSEWFQIDASGLEVKIATQQVAASWEIEYRRRPRLSFGDIVSQIENGIGAENFYKIFGLPNRSEPYKTFLNLFEDKETVRKIVGVVLAYIYRAEELRVQNG